MSRELWKVQGRCWSLSCVSCWPWQWWRSQSWRQTETRWWEQGDTVRADKDDAHICLGSSCSSLHHHNLYLVSCFTRYCFTCNVTDNPYSLFIQVTIIIPGLQEPWGVNFRFVGLMVRSQVQWKCWWSLQSAPNNIDWNVIAPQKQEVHW